jgi:hypothetical protein
MLAKHQQLYTSWNKVLNGGLPEELEKRMTSSRDSNSPAVV